MEGFKKLHMLINERRTEPGAYYYPDPWWEKEVDAIVSDLKTAMSFIRNECSDEELYWLAEVFDDVMAKTRSLDFLNCIRQRVQMVKDNERRAELLEDIKTAAEYIGEPAKE
jgi:hypothetical protein